MAEFYIGSRNGWDTIQKVAGGRVPKLNQKMAETLRKVAMKQGIKKSQKGQKLEFYSVNKEQLDRMLDPATAFMLKLGEGADFRPLVTVDGDKMTLAVRKVNSQPEYGRGMDYETHQKYLADLLKAVEDSVYKVNEDVKTEKKKHGNPGYQVGDMISHSEGYNLREFFPAVITKITEAGYQYQVYRPMFGTDRNNPKEWGENYPGIKGAKGWGDHWTGEINVPFLANKKFFFLHTKKFNKRWNGNDHVWTTPEDKVTYTNYWDHCN